MSHILNILTEVRKWRMGEGGWESEFRELIDIK